MGPIGRCTPSRVTVQKAMRRIFRLALEDAGAGRATPVRGKPGCAREIRGEGTAQGDAGPSAGSGTWLATCALRVQKKKGPLERFAQGARESSGDLLSRTRGPGTIGDLRLNFRVRDGNGCDPHSITAETISCMEF